MKKSVLMLAVLLLGAACATAPRATASRATTGPKPAAKLSPEAQQLHDEIVRLDTAMFDAFNDHDLERLMALFADDLEFFHDKGGLQTKSDVRAGFQNLFARNDGLRRDLVPGTLEIYPIGNYGALETGSHRFCHQENGVQDCGTFKFLQVWRRQPAGWQVTRIISYDH
jgi:ketosteroid isomerase-like protein